MPRHTFLDSILNRPSQSYASQSSGKSSDRQPQTYQQWNSPSDLPNVPASSSHASILGGSLFKKKSKSNFSSMNSDAGASTSTLGMKSRFGRKKRESVIDNSHLYQAPTGNYAYPAPSSVADSQATYSKRKSRWWEAGSLGIGRRNRTSSIAGDSIFSEPEPPAGQIPWTSQGLAGIGSGAKPKQRARSDFGASPSRPSNEPVPPLPTSPSHRNPSSVTGSPVTGRLPSNVAPLGSSSLNPSLNKKTSKSRLTPATNAGSLKRASSATALPLKPASPPPQGHRLPGSLASSPHVRRLSQDSKRDATDGTDWKDFVKGLSGTEISRAWEGHRDGPSMATVAARDRSSVNLERRKSHFERVQKELQQDAQFEQSLREPGLAHQDLLARAASQVVGSPPADEREADDYTSQLQPGAILADRMDERHSPSPHRSSPSPLHSSMQQRSVAELSPQSNASPLSRTVELSHSVEAEKGGREDSLEDGGEDAEESPEEEDSSEDSIVPKQTMLEVVREEDEDGSSQGTLSRRQTLTSSSSNGHVPAPVNESTGNRFKAFEAALNKSRYSTSSFNSNALSLHSTTPQSQSLRSSSISDATRPSRSSHDSDARNELPTIQVGASRENKSVDTNSVADDVETMDESNEQSSASSEGEEESRPPTPVAKPASQTSAMSSTNTDDARASPNSQAEEATEELKNVDRESDSESQKSEQTGRATVTFEKDGKSKDEDDARSTRSTATSRRSRQPTLQRRLSDLSLGTSFGMSNIMHIGRSRPSSRAASSRRIKLSDDDQDSTGSRSEGEDDEELRAKIKAEQERLRNMKVGDDFFGGSLSAILDKFDSTKWDDGVSSAVEQLGLDVGTSAKKRDSITAQDILALNAQERINEVRRLRADDSASPSKRLDRSDARTVGSGKAPSFAALWLLNQAEEKDEGAEEQLKATVPKVEPSEKPNLHVRQLSSASSEGDSTVLHSPTSRIRNIFSLGTSPERKQSIMDRPRNRGPKPREMGGVSIASGKLMPDAKAERPEDVRNTLSDIWTTQTLSQMKKEKELKMNADAPNRALSEGSEAASSPPASPRVKVASSKDKPAPLKSAIKGGGELKHSRSLADTLFSFPSNKESTTKAVKKPKEKGKSKIVNYTENHEPTKKEAQTTSVSSRKQDQKKTSASTSTSTAEQADETPKETLPAKREKALLHRVTQADSADTDDGSPSTGSLSLPSRPSNPNLQESDSEDDEQRQISDGAVQQTAYPLSMVKDQVSPSDSARSPPPTSELWSGESAVSTGPATPGVSEFFDRGNAALHGRNSLRHFDDAQRFTPSPRDKKLPLPPVPTFAHDAHVAPLDHDMTPLAVTYAEPAFADVGKTPRAEKEENAFGLNLIPPTPPATGNQTSSQKLLGVELPETLHEEASPNAVEEEKPVMQRSSSSRSKGSGKQHDGSEPRRKGSTKRKSSSKLGQTYQGQGLSLPPGLIATTVASSANKRHSSTTADESAILADPTAKSRKPKAKGKAREMAQENVSDVMSVNSSTRGAESFVSAPDMQPSLSAGLASLSLPVPAQSESSSSGRGSDVAAGISRTTSPSPSPAVSVSDRSSALSSAYSTSAASDASSSRGAGATKHTTNGQQPMRKIRTVTATTNGHARTSLMSAISEWENSPVGINRSSSNASPMPTALHMQSQPPSGYSSPVYSQPVGAHASGYSSPMYQAPSSVTRSQSSVHSGPLPSVIRNAPVGAPTDHFLHPAHQAGLPSGPGATRRLSMPMSDNGYAPWTTGSSYAGGESDVSLGVHSQHSATSLPNVPQSSYRAKDPLKASNAIDDRLYAKTTMSTVSVTSGAFRNKSLRARKSSVDLHHNSNDTGANGRRSSMDSTNEGMLVEELQKTTMSLTSHTPPPRKLSSTQVLVQVIACAIDEMDKLLLREKVRNGNAFGYVPGRSFCGRVMETGWEVKRMRMGDIVFGLQNSRKCGALAEFMTIEEDLVAKAPQDSLTMEQIAALPSVGVLAHQLMVKHCSQLKRGSRILILDAHDGVGLLTMQECASLGLIIVAHCPNNVADGVAICEANGAHEVIIGDALWALNTLHESSFDLVIDTIGGRRIYDASRRILAFQGQFCTCYGDLQNAVANPNLRSHLRSLRRSFFKKDTKQLGYEWVGTDTAEDCREALEAVRSAAEEGAICPRLKSVLAFGEAPRAFENTLQGTEEEPGATVVRIS